MMPPEPPSPSLNEEPPDRTIASATRALPPGICLDEFEIGEIIREGGVAIVYAAYDRRQAAEMAIAEYMPARLARRTDEGQVSPRTSADVDIFASGLKAFIKETHALAQCDHPSLVRVVRLWEANGTAYRVMPRYPSRRLLEARQEMQQPPDEEALRALVDALLGALEAFHHAGGCHGKVTPSNILLLDDGRPLLLGPGGARRAIAGDLIDTLMITPEPCFAPIEQIVEGDISLHPAFDLYALAGVARYWMSGQLPAPVFGAPGTAPRETVADTVKGLQRTWPELDYSASLVSTLDSALSIYPAERPRSVAEMRARLDRAQPPARGAAGAAATAELRLHDAELSKLDASAQPATPPDELQPSEAMTAFAPDPDLPSSSSIAHVGDDPSLRTPVVSQVPKPRRIAAWSGALVMLLALVLVGTYAFRNEPQVARTLEVLGISRITGNDASEAASSPAAPVTPPMAAGAESAKSSVMETTAAGAEAAKPAPPGPAVAGTETARPTAPESSVAGAGSAKSTPTEAAAAGTETATSTPPESIVTGAPTGAIAHAPPQKPDRATLAPVAPAATTQPAVSAPQTPRVAQQHARVPTSPREACGARTEFSLYRCMQTQCSQRRWASNAQCQHLRATDSVD